MKVSEVMTRDVFTLRPDQTLDEAARILVEQGISGAPVVQGEEVVGILSERDLLAARTPPKPPRYLELLGGIVFLDDVMEFQRQLEDRATRVEQLMTRTWRRWKPMRPWKKQRR